MGDVTQNLKISEKYMHVMNEREGKSGRMRTKLECRAFTRGAVELIRVHLYRGRYEPPSRAIWHRSGGWQRREVEEKEARNYCLDYGA